ncbi:MULTISPECIES: acyl-CoA dehydrogenase family protein [Pseudonocardia]|uniref:Acryloyl-CoA reductase (NADH) n=2 Tax=Pseudonocardia TaxID=1847 RepID=A0A1Y2NAM2_PSEAH|nr:MULTISPECIES: acyl-CoA dehydrogenase family protein [Pseudonocardia]OSY44209.1 Acryloyl-CoA reductase (NADH) [Pseudonocardia autotrophica]TDN74061.1 cyclohexanecarboxyl-CoA dehydrogenase [Pseudonocardia autotrophica]BBG04819.1 acyl-CoA dehydrogenase [Pseudonocardia autotrophica]GEC23475.1 acyl-CoA dehydrogenase [Pseudonocardia saturnea]
MDLAPTDTQQAYRERARRFAETELLPGYAGRERAGRIGPELRREMGHRGLIGPQLPESLGGGGTDRLTTGLVLEEIGRGDINVGYLPVVGALAGQILARAGDPELARHWVPRICSGEDVVGIGLTEPHAGSDAGAPRLTATRTGSDWVLDGVKSLSFAADAAAVVVFARTSADAGRGRGISAFLVPLDAPGVTIETYPDSGTRAVGRGAAHLDGVRVPADHLIGQEGEGFGQVMAGFDFSRALIGLQCVGCAQQTVDETWEYVSSRSAFDRPLSVNQGVAFPLAEADTLLAAARALCHRTLWLADSGAPHTAEAAMCKWWAPKTAHDAVTQCLLLHGQYGYRTELPIEQRMRDVLGLQIGDGTAQIMKLVIARRRLGRELAP